MPASDFIAGASWTVDTDDVQVGRIRWRRVRTFYFARLFELWAQEEQAYDDIFFFCLAL